MQTSFMSETELPGRTVNRDTRQLISHRYYWASQFVSEKKVLEVGCGATATLQACFMNRRIRNRTYGGVGGRRRWLRLLPDFVCRSRATIRPRANGCWDISVLLSPRKIAFRPGESQEPFGA